MAACPDCAEPYSWAQVWVGSACGWCGAPSTSLPDGRRRTWASENAKRVLDGPRARGDYAWLVGGTAVTLVVSLIPNLGVLSATVLPVAQTFVMERTSLRYKRHFGALHAMVSDFYGGFVFVALAVAQGVAGLFGETASAIATTPLFLVVWFLNDRYARHHFRQVALGQRPSWIELGGVVATLSTLVVPVLGLGGAVLYAFYGVGAP